MTDGYRKAALRLHGMAAADRGWMLQRLQPHERARLEELLRELQELGIKPGHRVSEELSADEAGQALLAECREPGAVARAMDAMRAARPAEISVLLAVEADHVAAALLSAYPWPWRAAVLEEYGVEKRQRMSRALMQAPRLGAKPRGELIRIAAERLAVLRGEGIPFPDNLGPSTGKGGSATRGRSFWQGIRRWLP
jgi:hypothetical protein